MLADQGPEQVNITSVAERAYGLGCMGALHGIEQMMMGSLSEEPCTFMKAITRAEEVRKELW